MSRRYLLVEDYSTYNNMIDIMFEESFRRNELDKIIENMTYNKFLDLMKRNRLIRYMDCLLSTLLRKQYNLYDYLQSVGQKTKVYIIFLNSSFLNVRYEAQTLMYYKKQWPNLRYILFYIDIISHHVSQHANYLRERNIFDAIYTVDEQDAKNYGLHFWRTPYSLKEEITNKSCINSDMYFCGSTKGRSQLLRRLILSAREQHVKVKMDIICDEKEGKILDLPGIHLRPAGDYLLYEQILRKTSRTNCILDVVQKGQKALTLRPYEAVLLNKKLLTNNEEIKKYEYYNSEFIQYFSNIDLIDWDWVKEPLEVDYHYQGEFSPNRLLNDIDSRLGGNI